MKNWGSLENLVYVRRCFAGLALATLLAGLLFPFLVRPSLSYRAHPDGSRPGAAPASARPLQEYLDVIGRKSIFQGGSGSGSYAPAPRRVLRPVASAPAAAPKPTLAQLAADFQVVGILNNDTQAVLSNKKTQETLYVNAGQSIGQITVTSVRSGGVTLTYDGQTMDLSF